MQDFGKSKKGIKIGDMYASGTHATTPSHGSNPNYMKSGINYNKMPGSSPAVFSWKRLGAGILTGGMSEVARAIKNRKANNQQPTPPPSGDVTASNNMDTSVNVDNATTNPGTPPMGSEGMPDPNMPNPEELGTN